MRQHFVNEITITQLASLYQKNDISVEEVVKTYLDRIEEYDKGLNGYNSVLEINPDAIAIAQKLDEQHAFRHNLLYGIPILLKDNIDTADDMHTSAGSLALADLRASADAEIVTSLRQKGAVILGKANMTEFANYMTLGMPAGYSSRGGQVKSPYKEGADPSGSSTGSAVAVTTNLCMASIGTDTSNSILSPAIQNSIIGFRPSTGLISRKGIIPISFTCDTAGPMTRTVPDAAIIIRELAGFPVNIEETGSMEGLRIGINEWALKNMNAEEAKKSEAILRDLQTTGAKITYLNIEPIPTNTIKQIQKFEFKYSMNSYLGGLPEEFPIKSLKDIIQFNHKNKSSALKYGQKLLLDAEENTSGELNEEEYLTVMMDRENKTKNIKEQLKELDICIMFRENLILQYAGLPSITIPHGLYNDGMPYGIIATALTDAGLLENAAKLERVIGRRTPPPGIG